MLISFKRIFSLSFFVQAKIFFSSMYISPFKLSNIPEIAYKNVVFPEPDGPDMVIISGISNEMLILFSNIFSSSPSLTL